MSVTSSCESPVARSPNRGYADVHAPVFEARSMCLLPSIDVSLGSIPLCGCVLQKHLGKRPTTCHLPSQQRQGTVGAPIKPSSHFVPGREC